MKSIQKKIQMRLKELQKSITEIENGISPGKIIAYESIISSIDSIEAEIENIKSGYANTDDYIISSNELEDMNKNILNAMLIQNITRTL